MRPLLLALALMTSSASAFAPAAVLAARHSAVQIMLDIPHPDGTWTKRNICTGAVVKLSDGPKVLTAGHCVMDWPTAHYYAYDEQGKITPMVLNRWAFGWPKEDYAVFDSAITKTLPALKVAPAVCVVGEDVYSWSGPMGLNIMLFHGEISGTLGIPDDSTADAEIHNMQYSSNLLVAPGASGSSVLNAKGEVTGILVGGWDVATKLNGAFFSPVPK